MFQFNKIDIGELVVIIALSCALIISIYNGMNELSMSVASGLLGYIGGASSSFKKSPAGASSLPETIVSSVIESVKHSDVKK